MDFAVRWRWTPGRLLLEVSGEVDVATAPVLVAAQSAALDVSRHVVLDLGGVSFIDATGLSALVAGHRYATDRGAVLEFAAVPVRVLRLFAITGLAGTLTTAVVPAPRCGQLH